MTENKSKNESDNYLNYVEKRHNNFDLQKNTNDEKHSQPLDAKSVDEKKEFLYAFGAYLKNKKRFNK